MNFRLTIRQVMGCYLALALLMVPLFGLMHGIIHGSSNSLSSVLVSANSQHRAQTRAESIEHRMATADAVSWSEKLFVGHHKVADCLVFDQLCEVKALHFLPLPVLPTTLPNFVLVTLAGDFIARWAALYQARGPPLAR